MQQAWEEVTASSRMTVRADAGYRPGRVAGAASSSLPPVAIVLAVLVGAASS